MRRKKVGRYEYLYEIRDRSGNGTSLGRWGEEEARQHAEYRARKLAAKTRLATAKATLEESGKLARALRVPQVAGAVGPILREADLRGLLDGPLLVVGTNCMAAYGIEAVAHIGAPDETQDIDLAWTGADRPEGTPVWDMLKAVDPTFTLNTEREFQARNADAYEVELLVAPSRADTLGRRDRPRPIPLDEQEWLLLGKPIDQVAICRDGSAVRIVAPDPRWFALHKLWLGRQDKRNPLKRRKDTAQGNAVLTAVAETMPHFPLDEAFIALLPPQLRPDWEKWEAGR